MCIGRKERQMQGRNSNGQGSFRKKGDKIEYRISYIDEYGRTKSKSFTADTREICLQRAEAFLEQQELKQAGMDPDITIPGILYRKAKSDYEKNYIREQGYGRTLGTIRIIEKSGIGTMPIAQVTGAHLEAFLCSITHYSNSMINKFYTMLRSAYRMAMMEGIIKTNYMEMRDLRCPRSDKPDKKVRGLTEEEQVALIEAMKEYTPQKGRGDYRLQLLIELYGGLRMGEINALKPEDIHLDKGFVHVSRTIARSMEYKDFIKECPKTDAGHRDVPISRKLEPVLKAALQQRKNNPMGLLFYDYNKKNVIATHQVNSFYKRLCEKNGIEYGGQHALRHTFATRCIEAGVPAVVLKNWMGHTDIHITLDTYADVFHRMNFKSVRKLDDYLEYLDKEQSTIEKERDVLWVDGD